MSEEAKALVAAELKRLTKEGGGILLPSLVIEAARDPSSILHEHFEWDDSVAAYQHRMAQARRLIRSVKVDIKTTESVVRSVAYVSNPAQSQSEPGYRAVSAIRSKEGLARVAMARELDYAASCLQRAIAVGEALGLVDEVRPILDTLAAITDQLKDEAA